jgi:hypothetical protein
VATGKVSGLVVVDIDSNDGMTAISDLCSLPPVPRCKTGKGTHLYFKYPGPSIRNSVKVLPNVDIRADGGYVVAPPSTHTNGSRYEWEASPGEAEPGDLPPKLLDLIKGTPKQSMRGRKTANDQEADRVRAGARNSTLTSLAGTMRSRGMGHQAIQAALQAENRARCAPPLDEQEVDGIAANVAKYKVQGPGGNEPQRARLVALTEEAELWHDADKCAYSSVPVGGQTQHFGIRSKGFRMWLRRAYFQAHGGSPSAQTEEDALRLIEARAVFEGEEHRAWLRVAEHEGALYLDLGDSEWTVIEITSEGWKRMQCPPVKFVRPKGMRSLPMPRTGGDISLLESFVNVEKEEHFILVVGWLLASFRPGRPFPIIIANGEQGSGKSFLTRLLRSLVDPVAVPIRNAPREERDLMAAARSNHIIALDNLSFIKDWLSDGLCRLATGAGFAGRELYTDAEEVSIEACRPIILNGIPDLAIRPDLADRSICIHLVPVSDKNRCPEAELWKRFEASAPYILGTFLDGVSCALRNQDQISLDHHPRMADFGKFVTAGEEAFNWAEGTILEAYEENRAEADLIALEANLFLRAIHELIKEEGFFEGTATELKTRLMPYSLVAEVGERYWRRTFPDSPIKVGNALRRVAPVLRREGIKIHYRRTADRRIITISRFFTQPRHLVTGVTEPQEMDGHQLNESGDGDDSNDNASQGGSGE